MHEQFFQILGAPARLRIVEALRNSEHALNDLLGKVAIRQSGVSRHLRVLREAGFVRVCPDGKKRLYWLRPERFRELDAWVGRYRSLWAARLDRFAEALGRKQKGRTTKAKDSAK